MQIDANAQSSGHGWLLTASLALLLLLFWLFVPIEPHNPSTEWVGTVQFTEDNRDSLALEQVMSLPDSVWQVTPAPVNLGMSRQAHWLKFDLQVPQTNTAALLQINYPLLDEVDIWLFDKAVGPEFANQYRMGDAIAFSQRPIDHETFVVPLPDGAREIEVYAKIQSQGSLKFPIQVWSEQAFFEYTARERLVTGLFFGLLIAMALSNLFFFLTTRNGTFLIYSGYVLGLALLLATLFGYGFEYLWPNQLWLQAHAISVFANATIMFAMLFTNQVLELKRHHPRISKYVVMYAYVFAAGMFVSLFLPYFYLIQVFLLLLLFACVAVFAIALWMTFEKVRIARYYTIAWLVLLVSAFAVGLDNLHVIALPFSSSQVLLYGATAEALLLALVLAISFGTQRDELERAQAQAIQHEKEIAHTKDELLAVEQKANDELEYKVQERTLELEITLRELSEANQELERLNTMDPLTGIRNRRHFDKRFVAEGRRSRREQTPLSLAVLDIDYFKRINDSYGHDVGDLCIKHIASLAKQHIKRPSDDLCRYGGEEFAMILPNTPPNGAYSLVEGIRMAIESTPCVTPQGEIKMTISCGIATAVVNKENGQTEIFKRADTALYDAKGAGRNQTMVANEEE